MEAALEQVWRFIRFDMTCSEFGEWATTCPNLESLVGPDLYLRCLVIDDQDPYEWQGLRRDMQVHLDERFPRECDCVTWRDYEQVEMDSEEFYPPNLSRLLILKKRTPWISLARCQACSQAWYLGSDTVDDMYYLSRLSEEQVTEIENDKWPVTFDHIENLWPLPYG